MAISSYKTYLKWGKSADAVEKVVDIVDFGDLVGDPNMIDTTTLSDKRQTQIPGTLTGGVIPFTVNYTKEDYATCKKDEGENLFFEIVFQDGSGYKWEGEYTLGTPGKGVDEAIQFTVNVSVSSDMAWFESKTA